MRRTFLFALAVLVSAPPVAAAPSGVNLSWNNCYSDGGLAAVSFACDSDTGAGSLIVSVVLPADVPAFAAAEVMIDAFVADSALPPWWQTKAGQCRADAITVTFDPGNLPVSEHCPAIWFDVVPLSVAIIQQGLGGPSTFRVLAGAAVAPGWEFPHFADGVDLIVARVTIQHTKTVGADACEGCRTGACFTLTEVVVRQPAGLGDFYIYSESIRRWATHNAEFIDGSPPLCTTPTLNRTWGAIKTLYR